MHLPMQYAFRDAFMLLGFGSQLSTWSFTWNAERSQNASGDDLKPMRMVYLFDASKVPQGREKIKALVDIQ